MFRILLKKYAGDAWLLLLCTSLILLMFPWVRIWTVAQFELSGFKPLIEQFRAFERYSPVPLEQFLTYEGVIGLTYAEPIMLLCLLTWSIARGSDVVSGELNRGSMELLLAQPIRRSTLLAAHAVVGIAGLAVLSVISFLSIVAGIHTNSTVVLEPSQSIEVLGLDVGAFFGGEPVRRSVPLSELVPLDVFIAPAINFFSLGFFMLALSVLVSSLDQYRWRTIGVVIGIYILQALLFVLAKSTQRTRWLMPFSFLAAYQPDWMVRAVNTLGMHPMAVIAQGEDGARVLGPMGYSLILLVLGCLCYAAAFAAFRRRDLPAPL